MVARFQSVISEEIKWQLKEKADIHQATPKWPDALPTHVIACVVAAVMQPVHFIIT